jgi:uncharacterized protein YggE
MDDILQQGITVSGVGDATVEPDTGFIDIGVQVTRASVAESRDAAAATATRVIASAKANGVESRDIQTTSLSITPTYEHVRDSEPRVSGYQVTNTLGVRVRDLAMFSTIIDAAVDAAGDDARVNDIRFGREDTGAAVADARAAAMADARARAGQLAGLAGLRLGRAVAIQETTHAAGPRPMMERAMFSVAGDRTPIEAGSSKVTVSVVVRYSIE